MRFTKIVCTIGPISNNVLTLTQLVEAGMDVARINFSHGAYADHAIVIERIRQIAAQRNRPIAILGDLQGPKLRVGVLPDEGVVLEEGKQVTLCTNAANANAIPCQYPGLPQLVHTGDRILLDDGLLELEVIETTDDTIQARVIVGGVLRTKKGINLPRADARIPTITEKDIEDLQFAIEHKLDWIALSFVRTAQEVLDLKAMIRRLSKPGELPQVVAKIEKPEAVENIIDIIQAADGIMVARGDLGIELPTEDVPLIQKQIIHYCNQAGKPVITATQMLDSMIRNPRPTRAEATDVANAVLDGTDAVMLSGETATGQYPVQVVQTMNRIVLRTEAAFNPSENHSDVATRPAFAAQAVAHAASSLARELSAAAIIAPTASGYTARQLSRYRSGIPIVAVAHNPMVYRQLNMHWGVFPLYSPRNETTELVMENAVRLALGAGLVGEGDLVVVTAGSIGSSPGSTDLIRVHQIEKVLARGKGLGDQKARGRVRKLRPPLPPDLRIDPTDIVVAQAFDSSWHRLVAGAGGLIAEEGSPQSVAAQLADELKIPALIGADKAFATLSEGDMVVIDPLRDLVYKGVTMDDTRRNEQRPTRGRNRRIG